MNYNILDGRNILKTIKEEIKLEISNLTSQLEAPILSIILIGDDAASSVYIQNLQKSCAYVGIKLLPYTLPNETPEDELLKLLSLLSSSREVNGILVHMPLPSHIDKNKVMSAINKLKDVDSLNPYNIGLLNIMEEGLKPCTPLGIIELLKRYNIDIEGKESVIVGRSNVVGKPLSTMLLAENSTVTVCHSYTKNLGTITKRADILISAVGKANLITSDMVKENAIVIDAGINVLDNGKICGDVDFDSVKQKVSYITPVPGGVGPMTNAMLLRNCLYAYKLQNNLTTI